MSHFANKEQRDLDRKQFSVMEKWRNEAIAKVKSAGLNIGQAPKNSVLRTFISTYNIDIDPMPKLGQQRRIMSTLSCPTNKSNQIVKKQKSINQPNPIGYKSRCRKDEAFDLNPEVFYKSWRWKELRLIALDTLGRRCVSCGSKPSKNNSVMLHVDHIKPLCHYPERALDLSNLQVLCEDCNQGKSWFNTNDYRDDDQREKLSSIQLSSISVTEEMMSRLHDGSM